MGIKTIPEKNIKNVFFGHEHPVSTTKTGFLLIDTSAFLKDIRITKIMSYFQLYLRKLEEIQKTYLKLLSI